MWKKINESSDELTEDEVFDDLYMVYLQLEKVRAKLNKSNSIKLRSKFMRPICDFMDFIDFS